MFYFFKVCTPYAYMIFLFQSALKKINRDKTVTPLEGSNIDFQRLNKLWLTKEKESLQNKDIIQILKNSEEENVIDWWICHSEYHIVNGELLPVDANDFEFIYPLSAPQLVDDFIKLYSFDEPVNENDVIHFCNKYGQLGRRTWAAKYSINKFSSSDYAETIEWIYSHSRQLFICMRLSSILHKIYFEEKNDYVAYETKIQQEPLMELAELLDCICIPYDTLFANEENTYTKLLNTIGFDSKQYANERCFNLKGTTTTVEIVDEDFPLVVNSNDIIAANEIIEHIMNENTDKISLSLHYNKKAKSPKLQGVFTCCCLMEHIYLQAHHSIISGKLGICLHCGNVYTKTRKGQQFCPRPEGEIGESNCATLYRKNKSRANAKKKK